MFRVAGVKSELAAVKHFERWQEEWQMELQAGVFGATWMREARAGVGIVRRRMHVRFCATCCPPAVRIFFGLAHFHTAATHFGFCAMAIAAGGRNAAQKGRRIRKKGQRTR